MASSTFDNFTEIPFNSNNLDRYVIRTSVKHAIAKQLPNWQGQLLDIGCGKMPYRAWILKESKVQAYVGLDIATAIVYDKQVQPDLTWDGLNMPIQDNAFDHAFGTEVLEHCPDPELVLRETWRVLKKDGTFFFTVPFLWNLHEVPHDEYRYTPFSLKRHLENAGFTDVKITATGGWHGAMAQMLGLWVRRSPMGSSKRKLLSVLIKPAMRYLLKLDAKFPIAFKEGQMITGLYGTARKP